MRRLVLLLSLMLVAPAWGATPPPALPPAATLDRATARQALAVLRNPRERAALEATLEAILRAAPAAKPTSSPPAAMSKPAAKPKAAATKPPVRLNPNGLGAAVLLGASRFLAGVSAWLAHSLSAARSLPLLWSWVTVMTTDPLARALAQEAAWRVAVVMALGLGVSFLLRRALPRARPAAVDSEEQGESAGLAPEAPTPAPDTIGEADAEAGATELSDQRARIRDRIVRLGEALGQLGRDLLPIIGFALVGHIAAATRLGGSDAPRLIVLALVDGYALWRVVVALVRFLVAPDAPRLRVVRMSDANAIWTLRWLDRIAGVAAFGYAIEQVGLLLGMSPTAAEALLKIAGLVSHVFLVAMIFQKRRPVRAWLRAPQGTTGPWARLRNALAPIWHWVVLGLLTAEWLIWAIELRHGYATMLRGLVLIVAVVVGARILHGELRGLVNRALHPGPTIAERFPGLETRLAIYHPVVALLLRLAVQLAALVLVLEVLGVGVFTWATDSTLGQRLVSGIATIGFTVIVALCVWEGVHAAMQAHLARLTRAAHTARAARMRTLLPLLRATLTVSVSIVAGLTVLSKIGIDVAPLLAGAGIIGVAIGFGSQKLVQDLITGIFLLLENAMQVGDWVTVSGLSGSVENLSVRTLRLRAGDGSVHIIPFSSVTSVNNTNRGLGNAAVAVTLAYSEDTDRAGAELKAITTEMRHDEKFGSLMLSELQLWGVDKLDGAAATLAGQIPCTDTGRWPVQREFNRRVKLRFQERGIALYNPSQSLMVPAPAVAAPPVAEAPHEPG